MSFHTLAKGSYPQSVNGAHFSPQLFKVDPAGGTLSRDYYREFYAEAFVGGQVRKKLVTDFFYVARQSISRRSASLGARLRFLLPLAMWK